MKVAIDDGCTTTFKDFKFGKIEARYLVFKIEKEKVILERVGKREESWHDFLAALPPKEFRFCVFEITFTNKDSMNISKIFFCNWSPDAAPIKMRMQYATGKENFRSALDLNGKEITINSADEINEANLIKEFDK